MFVPKTQESESGHIFLVDEPQWFLGDKQIMRLSWKIERAKTKFDKMYSFLGEPSPSRLVASYETLRDEWGGTSDQAAIDIRVKYTMHDKDLHTPWN